MRRLAPLLAAMLSTALLGASQTDADAETPLERGAYLVGAVAACGNRMARSVRMVVRCMTSAPIVGVRSGLKANATFPSSTS